MNAMESTYPDPKLWRNIDVLFFLGPLLHVSDKSFVRQSNKPRTQLTSVYYAQLSVSQ